MPAELGRAEARLGLGTWRVEPRTPESEDRGYDDTATGMCNRLGFGLDNGDVGAKRHVDMCIRLSD